MLPELEEEVGSSWGGASWDGDASRKTKGGSKGGSLGSIGGSFGKGKGKGGKGSSFGKGEKN